MKVRSREVNVFSMSALDLFASAMGAFMFLAIIALPFFPNTGDSAERVADIKSELKKAEAQIAEEQKQKAEIAKQRDEVQKKLDEEQSTSKISFPAMDMVIALDTTASMDKQVKGLRAEIVDIANLLMKLSPDAALGVIDFKDRCEPRGAIKSHDIIKLNTSSVNQLQRFVNTMRAGSHNCNQDGEEAINLAMNKALALKWRASSKSKTIIFISDNGAYASVSSQVLGQASRFNQSGEKSQVSTVFVPTQNALGRAYLKQLAETGGGKFVTGGGSFVGTVLLALAE